MIDDADGECNARLYIGDDYGDNHATMRCQLPEGHDGPHQEQFKREGGKQQVTITWTLDEREFEEEEEEDDLDEDDLDEDDDEYDDDEYEEDEDEDEDEEYLDDDED